MPAFTEVVPLDSIESIRRVLDGNYSFGSTPDEVINATKFIFLWFEHLGTSNKLYSHDIIDNNKESFDHLRAAVIRLIKWKKETKQTSTLIQEENYLQLHLYTNFFLDVSRTPDFVCFKLKRGVP